MAMSEMANVRIELISVPSMTTFAAWVSGSLRTMSACARSRPRS
jgi:hypothetical protein